MLDEDFTAEFIQIFCALKLINLLTDNIFPNLMMLFKVPKRGRSLIIERIWGEGVEDFLRFIISCFQNKFCYRWPEEGVENGHFCVP